MAASMLECAADSELVSCAILSSLSIGRKQAGPTDYLLVRVFIFIWMSEMPAVSSLSYDELPAPAGWLDQNEQI